jgi:hypothetical protein
MVPLLAVQRTAVFVVPVTVAVNCCDAPARTEALEGEMESEIAVGGGGVADALTVNLVPAKVLAKEAAMVIVVSTETLPIVIVNAPIVCPAATVVVAGTLATDLLLLVNATTAPLAGAAAFNVTVAVTVDPAAMEVEGTVTAVTKLAVTVAVDTAELTALAARGWTEASLVDPIVELDVSPCAGEPENELFDSVPQPAKTIKPKSIAIARNRPRNLVLNTCARTAVRR